MSSANPICPDCKGPMKPLAKSFFCPKDCDRPEVQEARAKFKAQMEADAKKLAETRVATNPWGFYYTLPVPGGINVPVQDPGALN